MKRFLFVGVRLPSILIFGLSLLLTQEVAAQESADQDAQVTLPSTDGSEKLSTEEGTAAAEPSKKAQREARRAELKAKVDALLQRPPEQDDYTTEQRCISSQRIRGIEVLDNQHVAIRLSRNEYYLVQFENRCPGMRRGQSVIYETRGNRLCVSDAIRTVEDFGFAGLQPGVKCFIPGFQSVTKEQFDGLKALLKNRRRGS